MKMTLSTGEKVTFPEEATPEEIAQYISIKYPDEYKKYYEQEKKEEPSQNRFLKEGLDLGQATINPMGKYGQDIMISLMNLGKEGTNLLPNLAELIGGKKASQKFYKDETDYAKKWYEALGQKPPEFNFLDKILQQSLPLTGMVEMPGLSPLAKIGGLASEIPFLGKYLKTAFQARPAQQAATQSLIAAEQNPENPFQSGLIASSLTLPFSGMGQAVSKMTPESSVPFRIARSLFPEKRAQQNLLERVGETNYQPMLEAAERQKLPFMTPSEVANDAVLAARESKLGTKSVPLTREKIGAFKGREAQEEKIINSLAESIFPQSKEAVKTELYSKVNPKEIPSEILNKFKDKKYYEEAKKYAEKEFNLENVPEDTVEFADKIRDSLWDLAQGSKSGKARELGNFRREFVKAIDDVYPEYKLARNLGEAQKTRQRMEDFFDKRTKTGENLSDYLESKKNYSKLEFHLRDNERALEQLKDVKLIFDRVKEINQKRAATQAISGERSIKEKMINSFLKIAQGHKYDEAGIKLITDPKWYKQLDHLSKIQDREKFLGEALELFGKALSQESIKFGRGEFGRSLESSITKD